MTEIDIRHALRASVTEVLEKMFFVQALAESPDSQRARPASSASIAACLTFQGEPPGSLTLCVTSAAARNIAADFLGDDEETISDRQMAEVVCELANMICGSLLSRVESAAAFNLTSPRIVRPAQSPPGATVYAVDLSNGTLTVAVTTGTPLCPQPAQSAS